MAHKGKYLNKRGSGFLRNHVIKIQQQLAPFTSEDIRIPHEHGGHLVCSIWNVLIFQLLRDPKPSYVKHFHELDEWQQKTDIQMFEAIEATVLQEISLRK